MRLRCAQLLQRAAVDVASLFASALSQNSISPRELFELYQERIRRFDPAIHAFVERYPAPRLPVRSAAHRIGNVGVGLPIALKDQAAVRWHRVRFGSNAVRLGGWSPFDDIVVARLRSAGLTFLGRTAMSEAGALPITEPRAHPPTRNPYDRDRSSGGSSGGSAAAVAAGLAPWALGADGGGSLRIPAAFCGVVGFKPSRGRVINPFLLDSPTLLWTCGPIAHSVADARLLLEVLSTPGPGLDRWWLHRRQRRLAGTAVDLAGPQGHRPKQRIRWTTTTTLGRSSDTAHAAVLDAASHLARLGHDVVEGAPLTITDADEFLPLWRDSVGRTPLDFKRAEPFTRWLVTAAQAQPTDVPALVGELQRRVDQWFGDADVWLTPTVSTAAPRIGQWSQLSPPEIYAAAAELAAFTAPFNIGGNPALSLPWDFCQARLPVGVQLVGRRGSDAALLDLATTLEALAPFAAKRQQTADAFEWGQDFPSGQV